MEALIPYDEPDTVVDEEIEMQVYGDDDGRWHRRAIGERTTACGLSIPLGAQLRHNDYTGGLCRRGCFTSYELGIAALSARRKDHDDGR